MRRQMFFGSTALVLGIVVSFVGSAAVNGEGEAAKDHGDRVLHGRDLSGKEHYHEDGAEHDADYDHEAFLGADEAEEFDHLTPEESQERLAAIVDRIDKVLKWSSACIGSER